MILPRVLYVVVCGAGPAAEVGKLVTAAQTGGWEVQMIATPAGWGFLDVAALESLTGHPVRSAYRSPKESRRPAPPADAIMVAPATYNTINKLAAGVTDNYALGVVAECIGRGVPVVIMPFINSALAGRAPLQAAVLALRAEGVYVLLGPNQFEPHAPGQGATKIAGFPWMKGLAAASEKAV